jgi:hypothetical protein
MTRTAEEIERDAEATRADLDRTVEALKEKMTPQNLASEMMTHARNTPAAQRAIRLGHQAQDNAVPLALMGAGLAWLMFNRRRDSSYEYEYRSFRPSRQAEFDYDSGPETGYMASDYDEGSTGGIREKVRGLTGSAKDKIGSGADRARDAIGAGTDRTRQALSSARGAVSSAASTAADRARIAASATRERAVRYGHRAEETFMDTLEREPLIIGALGIAVGAAVGAALPSTPIEDRYVGPMRDKVLDEGKTRAREGFEQAKQVARTTVDTLKQEAQAQGLTDVDTLVDKAKSVAQAGVDTAKREVEARRGH